MPRSRFSVKRQKVEEKEAVNEFEDGSPRRHNFVADGAAALERSSQKGIDNDENNELDDDQEQPIDSISLFGLQDGDRVEVEWTITSYTSSPYNTHSKNKKSSKSFSETTTTHWWAATLLPFQQRRKNNTTIRMLEYDAFPDGGFPDATKERVIFLNSTWLKEASGTQTLRYRKISNNNKTKPTLAAAVAVAAGKDIKKRTRKSRMTKKENTPTSVNQEPGMKDTPIVAVVASAFAQDNVDDSNIDDSVSKKSTSSTKEDVAPVDVAAETTTPDATFAGNDLVVAAINSAPGKEKETIQQPQTATQGMAHSNDDDGNKNNNNTHTYIQNRKRKNSETTEKTATTGDNDLMDTKKVEKTLAVPKSNGAELGRPKITTSEMAETPPEAAAILTSEDTAHTTHATGERATTAKDEDEEMEEDRKPPAIQHNSSGSQKFPDSDGGGGGSSSSSNNNEEDDEEENPTPSINRSTVVDDEETESEKDENENVHDGASKDDAEDPQFYNEIMMDRYAEHYTEADDEDDDDAPEMDHPAGAVLHPPATAILAMAITDDVVSAMTEDDDVARGGGAAAAAPAVRELRQHEATLSTKVKDLETQNQILKAQLGQLIPPPVVAPPPQLYHPFPQMIPQAHLLHHPPQPFIVQHPDLLPLQQHQLLMRQQQQIPAQQALAALGRVVRPSQQLQPVVMPPQQQQQLMHHDHSFLTQLLERRANPAQMMTGNASVAPTIALPPPLHPPHPILPPLALSQVLQPLRPHPQQQQPPPLPAASVPSTVASAAAPRLVRQQQQPPPMPAVTVTPASQLLQQHEIAAVTATENSPVASVAHSQQRQGQQQNRSPPSPPQQTVVNNAFNFAVPQQLDPLLVELQQHPDDQSLRRWLVQMIMQSVTSPSAALPLVQPNVYMAPMAPHQAAQQIMTGFGPSGNMGELLYQIMQRQRHHHMGMFLPGQQVDIYRLLDERLQHQLAPAQQQRAERAPGQQQQQLSDVLFRLLQDRLQQDQQRQSQSPGNQQQRVANNNDSSSNLQGGNGGGSDNASVTHFLLQQLQMLQQQQQQPH